MVLICWLATVFTYLLARRVGMGRGPALLAVGLLAFASPWLAYNRSFFSEPAIGLSAVIALWAAESERPIIAALAAAAAALFKPPFALVGAAVVIDKAEQRRWREAIEISVILAVAGIALMVFNYWLARTLVIAGNNAGPWPFGSKIALGFSGLGKTLLAPDHGLIVWAPWTVFAIFPIGLAFCSRTAQPRFLREMSFATIALLVLFALLPFDVGFCYGPRLWVPLLPWLAVAAVAVARACGPIWRATFAVLVLISIAISIPGALRYSENFSRSPWYLWHLRQNDYLAVLRQ